MPETAATIPPASSSIGDLIQAIENDWMLGWIACQVAKRHQQHRDAEDFPRPSWLHQMSYVACEREALMTAARLTDRGSNSLSIYKLLNVCQSSVAQFSVGARVSAGRAHPPATVAEVHAFVREAHSTMTAQKDSIARIRTTRDKVLAHSDRVRLTDPSQLGAYHVNLTELERVLLAIREITQRCRQLYENSTFYIDNIEEDLDREFGFLREAYGALRAKIEAEMEERRQAGPWA